MPKQSNLHVDSLLSNISVKYRNTEFIASLVFPIVNVMKDSDLYRIFTPNFRIPYTKRANRGLAREHQFEVSTASYLLERHALKDYVSDDDATNYDIGSLRADATEELTDKIDQRLEKSVADLFTSTNWSLGVSLAAGSAWSANTTVSNPIPLMDTAATTIIQNSGYKPTYGIIPRNGFVAAKNHLSLLDRTKYTSKEMTPDIMKGLFDLPEIHVPISIYDTSAEGLTSTLASIWGNNAFVGYKPPRASPKLPSAGYIFMRSKPTVKRWRVEERESEAIEVQKHFDARVIASLTGYLIRDIT